MIKSITELIAAIQGDLSNWKSGTKPWFRGESGKEPPLCPKIANHNEHEENHLLQSFRRQAGGLANVPLRQDADMWLFLAQHYGVPTRLLDWTEGALHALYFAINRSNSNPRVYQNTGSSAIRARSIVGLWPPALLLLRPHALLEPIPKTQRPPAQVTSRRSARDL